MAGTDKRKQSLYFPEDMLNEIMKEAIRLDRSLSWIVQRAWRISCTAVHTFPAVDSLVAASEAAPRTPTQLSAPESVPAPERQPGAQVLEFLRREVENT